MRPLYETAGDVNNEQAVARDVESAFQCRLVKLPIRYGLDYAIEDEGQIKAWAEVKVRNYTMKSIGNMGGYLLSLGKWMAAKSLYESTNLPFVLIVRTTDGLYYSKFKSFIARVEIRGRQDRGDWQDMEPCVLIDVGRFNKLEG